MTGQRKENFNPPVDNGDSPGSAETHDQPRGLNLETTLDTARTGDMGGMAGTMTPDVDDDRDSSEPGAQ